MKHGLIGNWSPGIGDPSIGGWLTVLLYAAAAWATFRLLITWKETNSGPHERWFWRALLTGLVFLGVNKQLDLQSALTEIGRILADKHGWYADRHQLQMAFIAGIALMGLTLFAATLQLTWGAPAPTRWAMLGGVGLVVFVVIRAASFHHVDAFLGYRLSGIPVNWLLEMGSLLLIIVSALQRQQRS